MNPAAAAAGLPLSLGDLHVRLIDFGSAVDKHSIEHLYSTEGPSDDEQTAEYAPPEALLARSVSLKLHFVLETLSVCPSVHPSVCVCVCVCRSVGLSVCLTVCVRALLHSLAVLVLATKPEAPAAHPKACLPCQACMPRGSHHQCTHLAGSLDTRCCMPHYQVISNKNNMHALYERDIYTTKLLCSLLIQQSTADASTSTLILLVYPTNMTAAFLKEWTRTRVHSKMCKQLTAMQFSLV